MVESPCAQGVLLGTGDAFKSTRLERMLSNFAASYKLYWFKGIFDEVCSGNREMAFDRVVARMVASAWYPVIYFRLNLGASDVLGDCVDRAHLALGLRSDAPELDIIAAMEQNSDTELARRVRDLQRYVPFRLIRPFYEDRISQERAKVDRWIDRMVDPLIVRFNREDAAGAPYVFNEACDRLTVQYEWAEYLRDNEHVIRGWLDMKLVQYLQARNPSVPAIPMKIYPPQMRDLAAAKRYWTEAVSVCELAEIYTGEPFSESAFAERGSLSIDHFVPWSFVLHDEPWNLAPMFRNTNSSKGDRLPNLDEFLVPFCDQQFEALLSVRNTGRHKKIIDSYTQAGLDVAALERSDTCRRAFVEDVSRIVRPLHQIALNQGFAIWQPSYEYGIGPV